MKTNIHTFCRCTVKFYTLKLSSFMIGTQTTKIATANDGVVNRDIYRSNCII